MDPSLVLPIPRLGLGLLAPAGQTPLSILGSSVISYSRADVTVVGSDFQWTDLSGNGRNHANTTAASGPSITAVDATLNNRTTLSFNGTSQWLDMAWSFPVPATTATFIWMVVKFTNWISNRAIIQDSTANRGSIIFSGTTPTLAMADNTVANTNSALAQSAWGRLECGFTGSTSDFLKLIATEVNGSTSGSNAGGGTRRLFVNNTATIFSAGAIAEICYANVIPNANKRAMLDAYVTARYGSGLV